VMPEAQRVWVFSSGGLLLRVAVEAAGGLRLQEFAVAGDAVAPTDAWPRHYPFYLQGEQARSRYLANMGMKHHFSLPGKDLAYRGHREENNALGQKVEWTLEGAGLRAIWHWQLFADLPVLRVWLEVENIGEEAHTLDGIAPLQLFGLSGYRAARDWQDCVLHVPYNSWCAELQWRSRTLAEYGLTYARNQSSQRIYFGNTGTWSTKELLPMAVLEDAVAGSSLFWQIESNGSWGWEISDIEHDAYVTLGLLNEANHHWVRTLQPGERCVSLPVAVGKVDGGFDDALGALTRYRRRIRRPHADNRELPVIFNDYMNCLFADPSSERERPYIAAAAAAGCEIYVIDAAWYARRDETWWASIGAWQPSPDRFDGGIHGILNEIRAAGMRPGLWLEIESMGENCPLAAEWPDECFFMRHGKRVITRGRLQLDFRHPLVRAHANAVVDRMVGDYGVAYIKMDYNIDTGIGTTALGESAGEGLLQHCRAYLEWLDVVMNRYPELVIENCGSGGLRMDYALLARHSIQSSSDQEDFRLAGRIAAAAATGAAPEQQAIWAYPLAGQGAEAVVFNMINALLGRVQLSGQLALLEPEARALVHEAICIYKSLRGFIPESLPFWPLGLPQPEDAVWCYGLRAGDTVYLVVWNPGESAQNCELELPGIDRWALIYPSFGTAPEATPHSLRLALPPGPCARLLFGTLASGFFVRNARGAARQDILLT
jgi:alpha-galactosidase